MGEHVLTMRNTIDNDIVHVDAFIIKSPDGQTPQILTSDGSSLPNRPPPASPSVPSSSPGSSLAVASVSSTGTLSSTTGTTSVLPSLATTTTSGFKTVTISLSPSIGDQTTVLGSQPSADQPSTQGSTTINYQADLSSPPNRKPVIAAGVLGALVFVSLAFGLAFLVWRRRRRRQQLAPSMSFPYPQSPQPFDHIPNEPLPHYERHQTPARELGPNTPDPLRPGTPESAFSDMLESTTEKKDLGDVGYPAYHNKGARMTMESNVSGKEFGNAF
ncbi:hypothetical protein BJ165DRAFT_263792 [Panaeolus papilionaceus]|nr:hypothetical protein BJ165DRAFT_263792 [Panaeolus papilionaceus]